MTLRRQSLTPDAALSRAAALCAKCEQCSPDILRKLDSWGIGLSAASRIIERLEELNFLDDARYARAYAHDKLVFSGWGRMKIIQGLWAKRIPRDLIDAAVEDLDVEEYSAVLRRVIASRLRLSPALAEDYEGRMKLMRFGAQRGFELSLVSKTVSALVKELNDAAEDEE